MDELIIALKNHKIKTIDSIDKLDIFKYQEVKIEINDLEKSKILGEK